MRMLVLILLALNAGLTAYYLTVGSSHEAVVQRPQPGQGTLELVSEEPEGAAHGQGSSKARGQAAQCWYSPPVTPPDGVSRMVANLEATGYRVLSVVKPGSGFAVSVTKVETIQEAAEQLQRLDIGGIARLRVRPEGEALLLVSERLATRVEAEALARKLRKAGMSARVISDKSPGVPGAVRITVRGTDGSAPPGRGWQPVDCQVEPR